MVSLQSPPIVKHHHPSLQSPPRVKHHHPSPRLQKWPDSTWPSTSKVHIALRMKTKIILSFKAAFKSLLAPSFYSIYYSPLFSLFAECAVPSAKTPICSTLSNSHCYPKLLPDHSSPFKCHFLQETFPDCSRKGKRVILGTPSHLQLIHQEAQDIILGIVQCRGNTSLH